jgi:CRP-like cAMP-binding protein
MTDNAYLIELLQANPPSQRDGSILQELQCLLLKLGMLVQKETDLSALCREVEVTVLDTGSLIYMQGETASCYFVVLRGAVDLYYEHDCAVEDRQLQQLAPFDLNVQVQDGRCALGEIVAELKVCFYATWWYFGVGSISICPLLCVAHLRPDPGLASMRC